MSYVRTFPPYVPEGARLLLLGSAPSIKSLEAGFYYGHPRNRFWPLLARLCKEPVPDSWDARRALLDRHGIALWDVIEVCEREGSTDARIKNPVLSDVPALLACRQSIEAVGLNGSLAAKLFTKHGSLPVALYSLPSTSPIPRRDIRNLDDLYLRWRILESFLSPIITNTER